MKGTKIKELTKEDLDKDLRPLDYIVQKHHGVYAMSVKGSWEKRLPMLKEAFKTGRYGIIVAVETETDTICAFLDYWIIHCFVENMNIAFLQNMRVIEYLRGKGIGTMLVNKFIEIADKRWNCGEVHVMAGKPADEFYSKFGFKYKPSDIYMEARIEELKKKGE